ncbi:MAG: protein kinase [Planctomycetes bacterium]|nr:protein kinase [Planctomycetota bacterium]
MKVLRKCSDANGDPNRGIGELNIPIYEDSFESAPSLSTETISIPGYEILEELGRGGMAIVYRAFDRQHNRQVAVKVLKQNDPTALQRFKREFRVLQKVAHPNLVRLFELNSDGKLWFLTMELIEGVTFLEYVHWGTTVDDSAETMEFPHTGGLSQAQLGRLRHALSQLARGVMALHDAGALHHRLRRSEAADPRCHAVFP